MTIQTTIINELRDQFSHHVRLTEKRPGIYQVHAPLFHEDGDMLDIFVEPQGDKLRVCDFGMTLMRLSYSFELDTDNKRRIFREIISQNRLSFDEPTGNIFIDTSPDALCPAVLQFAQAVAKVSRLDVLKREVVSALFFEMIDSFISTELTDFDPQPGVVPIPGRDELEVPWAFMLETHPVYLFPVRNSNQAKLATIAFLEFQRAELPFKGYVAHEDSEALPLNDRRRLMSAADKQFYNLDDFRQNARTFLNREAA